MIRSMPVTGVAATSFIVSPAMMAADDDSSGGSKDNHGVVRGSAYGHRGKRNGVRHLRDRCQSSNSPGRKKCRAKAMADDDPASAVADGATARTENGG
jgi:hypothetical protein